MNVKALRESRNMTQLELGKLLSVTRSTIAMWETGQSLPRAELLPKIASILDCTVDEILRE